MLSTEIMNKAHKLLKALRSRDLKLSVAESCTGGLIASVLTEIPGISEVFERGYVTYSNESKIELLTVPTYYINEFGAVSFQTAVAMAEGALLMSRANISISVTGIAGPEGGTDEKPVGTVFIASSMQGSDTIHEQHLYAGSRHAIREKSVEACIDMLLKRLGAS
jgi:nicotinamide-nucleotide amidase